MNLPRGRRTIRQVLSGLANVRSAVRLPRGRFIRREPRYYEDWPKWRLRVQGVRYAFSRRSSAFGRRIRTVHFNVWVLLLAGTTFLAATAILWIVSKS